MALFGFGKKNIDPAEAGQKAFEKNNIPEALRLWRISAETGHAGAIHALYSSVKEGWLPEYDKDTVRLLLKLAGEAGNTEAMDKVSGLYMGGYGVQKDREEGLRWKVKAAELGHFQAAYDLADSYFTGYRVSVDVEKDYEKALFWAKKALPLVQEDADKKGEINHIIWKCETELGLYKLGMIAFNAGDYTEALTRFSGAAEKGDTEAAKALYTMYLTGRGVAKDEKKAFGWKLKAAELGDPDAMFDVAADYLLEREGMERDLDKALFWAEKVKQAQEGKKPDKPRDVDRLVAACRDAKRIDSFNRGLDAYKKEAYPEALTCFKDAADLGDTGAMYNLFLMYQN
ncbi:MAG: sel1 repeat family protein, partial [Oscillospiraceae bacterium]|nr:sel1 repeat family protein [Oscillospiraceae bacterium]